MIGHIFKHEVNELFVILLLWYDCLFVAGSITDVRRNDRSEGFFFLPFCVYQNIHI